LGDYNLGEAGLQNNEKAIFDKYKIKPGHCLVLCCGGGREAIALAKQGFTVTAVDFVEQLVQQTIENSKRAGFPVKGIVGDISNLVFPANSFNLIYFASASYSYIPTRKKRIAMLKTLKGMLAPDGYIICQFFSAKKAAVKINKSINLKKLLAWLCRGNIEIEDGDAIWENAGFIHIFHFFHELLNELSESGLEIMGNPAEPFNSNYVVLKKTQQTLSSHLKT
jgi:SAM-dependent methyltransferase